MRVDTGSAPKPGSALSELDARAQLRRYFGAFKRGWPVLLTLTVLGAGLGWLSAPSEGAVLTTGPSYYRATHTLLRETANSGNPTAAVGNTTLSQAAFLVGTGEVPALVADELDIDLDQVEGALVGVPRESVGSIEIQALGTDRELVVKIADAAAQTLLDQLSATASTAYETKRDDLVQKLERLENEINAVNLQLAVAVAGDVPRLEGQQRSLTNQYSLTYEQFTQLANQPPPSAGLVSLEGAKAEEIADREFDRAKKEIREGLPYITGAPTTTTPQSGGGGSGPGEGASAPTRAVLGGIVGLAAAIGVLLAVDRFDNRLRHRDEIEAATGLTVLAEIPPLSRGQQQKLEVIAHTQHRSRAAEAYRVVRSALLFAVNDEDGPSRPEGRGLVVMVTSPNPEEGKTTTVANLASVLAEGGFSVLVINCDFRRPRVHKYLLAGADTPDRQPGSDNPASAVISNTAIDRVKLVTGVGENDPDANPLDVVALQRKIVQTAVERFDVVLLDTAPFLTTNDASELLSEVDQVILVVRSGKTRRLAAARTAEVLERFEAPVTGIVLNDSDESPAAQYYYSYYLDGGRKKKRSGGSHTSSQEPERSNAAVASTNGSSPTADTAEPSLSND